jgi:DNA-binding transcriptional LysR family regulator
MGTVHGRHLWQLSGPRGKGERVVEHHPRLVTDDMLTLKRAALLGLGVVVLPEFLCADAIASGELEPVLPSWECAPGNVHAVYPSRHGQPPAVRSFLDFVAPRIEATLRDMQRDGNRRAHRARRVPATARKR